MKCSTIWIGMLFCSMWCNAAEVGKGIVVDRSKFSEVYPAVWFSPATGEVVSLKERSERPPEEKFEIWIEPRDPEFGFGAGEPTAAAKEAGFAFVGKGAEVFEKTETWQATKLDRKLTHLMKEAEGKDHLVFYCRARKSACLIMITDMAARTEVISFRWRPLTNQER